MYSCIKYFTSLSSCLFSRFATGIAMPSSKFSSLTMSSILNENMLSKYQQPALKLLYFLFYIHLHLFRELLIPLFFPTIFLRTENPLILLEGSCCGNGTNNLRQQCQESLSAACFISSSRMKSLIPSLSLL